MVAKGLEAFEGPERIALLEPLGKPMRFGTPAELEVSDYSRVFEALTCGESDTAQAYLAIFYPSQKQMADVMYEWALECCESLSHAVGSSERSCSATAFEMWEGDVRAGRDDASATAAVELLCSLLDPEATKPGASSAFRRGEFSGRQTPSNAVGERQASTLHAIAHGDMAEALAAFENAWQFAAALHDGLVSYVHAYHTAAAACFGQDAAVKLLKDSFSACSFFEGLWSLPLILSKRDLAGFLAEHLRDHFSGHMRGGVVSIVEETDRFRLVVDPCGSGGAMRRRIHRLGKTIDTLSNSCVSAWGLERQVPYYCAHCALNELESVRRFGYPVLVTEFDPDPEKSCGWTIYKDPAYIPEKCYARLGIRTSRS